MWYGITWQRDTFIKVCCFFNSNLLKCLTWKLNFFLFLLLALLIHVTVQAFHWQSWHFLTVQALSDSFVTLKHRGTVRAANTKTTAELKGQHTQIRLDACYFKQEEDSFERFTAGTNLCLYSILWKIMLSHFGNLDRKLVPVSFSGFDRELPEDLFFPRHDLKVKNKLFRSVSSKQV